MYLRYLRPSPKQWQNPNSQKQARTGENRFGPWSKERV